MLEDSRGSLTMLEDSWDAGDSSLGAGSQHCSRILPADPDIRILFQDRFGRESSDPSRNLRTRLLRDFLAIDPASRLTRKDSASPVLSSA